MTMEHILRQIEERLNDRGWDNTHPLILLIKGGEVDEMLPIGSVDVLVAIARPTNPAQLLLEAAWKDLTRQHQPDTIAFAAEGWRNDQYANAEERNADSRDLADVPGSLEVRVINAIEVASGDRHCLMRTRGLGVEYWAPDMANGTEGRVVESLKLLREAMVADTQNGEVHL